MARIRRDQEVEFRCMGSCDPPESLPPTWMVEGHFNAEGRFEPTDEDDTICVDCDVRGEPTDGDVQVDY